MGLAGLALGAQAASPILGGLGARADARAQKQQAEINAYIGKTRVIQTDTAARESLAGELATFRTVMATNAQRPSVGTYEIMQDLRDVRGRERRVEVANRNQEVSAYKMQAQAYGATARLAPFLGLAKAAQPLYALFDLRKNGGPLN